MASIDSSTDLSAEKYVLFTSFKRDGTPRPTAVWIAPLADGRVGFTTALDSFKVKRVRRNPSVVLQPCDARGRVRPGTEERLGTATVVVGAEAFAVRAAIIAKYGWQGRLIEFGGRIKQRIRRQVVEDAGIIVDLGGGPAE